MTDHNHDLDLDDLSLPIALKRTRRAGLGIGTVRRNSGVVGSAAIKSKNPVAAVTCTRERETSPPTPPTTPRTPRRTWKNKITKSGTATVRRGNKSHLHLSSGLAVNSLQLVEADELSLSTGLTPMVRHTSLQPPSPAPAAPGSLKCTYRTHNIAAVTPSHRLSAPAATTAGLSSSSSSLSSSSSTSTTKPSNTTSNPSTIEVIHQGHLSSQVLSLRLSQVHYDGRIKPKRRSIQEKMNRVYTERRRREKEAQEAQEAQEEIQRLRAELKEKNEAIERSHQVQDDDTVDLDLDLELDLPEVGNGKKVEAGSSSGSNGREVRGHVGLREDVTEGKRREVEDVAQHSPQNSPETPSNPTFHTALEHRLHDPVPGSGSGLETEALSLTTSQFSEAIRAQLDCSTPPPSGSRGQYRRPLPTTTTTTTTAVRAKPFPSPPTTSPMAMATGMVMGLIPMTGPGAGAGTELPITPCSNSRHGGSASAMLSSRRTSNATTIQLHNLSDERPEVTPTRSRTSYPPSGPAPASTSNSAHHHHHNHPNPNPNQQHPTMPLHQEQLTNLTNQNQSLQTTLLRTQRSLRVALETVKKFQIESEHLRGEALLLQREKKELMEVITDVPGHVQSAVQSAVRKAVEKRDEMWKGKIRILEEGIVEGVRGAFEEVVEEGLEGRLDEEGLDEEMSGVDEMRGYGSLQEGGRGSSSRKRGREEEEGDEEEEQEGGDGESVELGSGHSGDAGGGSYDDGLGDMERRIMKMRERMMRKRRRRRRWEEDTDPDA